MCNPTSETVCETINQKTEATTTKTVTVLLSGSATPRCDHLPAHPGYGYHQYGHNYCKEVALETCYHVPVINEDI